MSQWQRILFIIVLGMAYYLVDRYLSRAYGNWKQRKSIKEPTTNKTLSKKTSFIGPDSLPNSLSDTTPFAVFFNENRPLFEKNLRTYGQILIEDVSVPSLMESKFGGAPYWPKGMAYPLNEEGERLAMIAQINCADVPLALGWPSEGMVQFFMDGYDDLMGLSFEDHTDQKGFRIIYHPDITLESEKQALETAGEYLPLDVTKPLKIKIITRQMLPDPWGEEINEKFAQQLEEFDEEYDQFSEDFYGNQPKHQIGGYAYFTQRDPRDGTETLKKYTTLLLQIDTDTDQNICWGDMGVGNFFITPTHLKKGDFTKVAYNWDCH